MVHPVDVSFSKVAQLMKLSHVPTAIRINDSSYTQGLELTNIKPLKFNFAPLSFAMGAFSDLVDLQTLEMFF